MDLCLLIVISPNAMNAPPIARIKKSAGMSIAQISLTLPAQMNNRERKTKAIPVIVSPLILSNPKFFLITAIKMISPSIQQNEDVPYILFLISPILTFFPSKKHENKWNCHDCSGDKYWLKLTHINRNSRRNKIRKRIESCHKEPQRDKQRYEVKVLF